MIRMTRWSVSIQSSLTPPYGTLLCGPVAYFAPDAPDFQEAGEVSGAVVERYRRFWEM